MKKNGFTLIELLAVIVVLAITALIATPVILNVIGKAKKGAAESSALGYIDAVEKLIVLNEVSNTSLADNVYTIDELKEFELKIKGHEPSEGWVYIKNKTIKNYALKFNDYVIEPDKNGVIVSKDKDVRTVGTELITSVKDKSSMGHDAVVIDQVRQGNGYALFNKNGYINYNNYNYTGQDLSVAVEVDINPESNQKIISFAGFSLYIEHHEDYDILVGMTQNTTREYNWYFSFEKTLLQQGKKNRIIINYDYQNSVFYMYMNGTLAYSEKNAYKIFNGVKRVDIGIEGLCCKLNGRIYDIALYNRLLTEDEINEYFETGKINSEQDIEFHYDFEN